MLESTINSITLLGTSRLRHAILTGMVFLAASGAQAKSFGLDLEGMVVCGVPPTEAVAYTERREESRPGGRVAKVRWIAVGPDNRSESRPYKTERRALAEVTTTVAPGVDPIYVCDITDGDGRTVRFWRLHRDIDKPYFPPPRTPKKAVHHVIYRGLKRTGRVLRHIGMSYAVVGKDLVVISVTQDPALLVLGLPTIALAPLATLVLSKVPESR